MKVFGKKKGAAFIVIFFVLIWASAMVFSHCQIPCGIYGDPMRFDMIAEHITTIEKSMKEIKALSQDKNRNDNQLVRWIINKENHSDDLSEIVTEYFMKQRITPVDSNDNEHYKDYVNKITLLHKLSFYSMKCKQTTDLDNVAKLREYLKQFRTAYLGSH